MTAIFIDVQKAFDCADRLIFFSKLKKAGVDGLAGDFLKDYLSIANSYQYNKEIPDMNWTDCT